MIQRMFATVDIKKTNYKNVGKINHGDDLILEIRVLSDGNTLHFNNPMVDLLVKKSDGKMVRQTSGIELTKPNIFLIEVSKDCVTSPGLTTNQLIINDDGRVSTCMFYYTVLNSLEEDVMPSISNVEVLEQLDEFVVQIQDKMELFDSDLAERMDELTDSIVELEKNFNDTSSTLNEAEVKRSEAEQLRVQAEVLRVQNEDKRAESENVRDQNESDRAAAELVREQREVERVLNDEERHQNESERAMNEELRQRNESVRQSNESIRMSNETDRKTQENRRATAETNRVNAETTRRNNENSRISNETERQKAMNEMKSLIGNVNDFNERVGVIEDEIEGINSSLDNIVIDVIKSGYIGNDVKSDTEKIQKIINNLPYGATLLFKGEYNLNSLNLKNNIKLLGYGAKIIGNDINSNIFNLNNSENITIEGFEVSTLYNGNINGKGHFVGGSGKNIVVKNNTINGTGILISNGKNIEIINNKLYGINKTTENGIRVINCVEYNISNNNVNGYKLDGIKVSNLDQSETPDVPFSIVGKIKNNISSNNFDDGIDIYAGGCELIVDSNHCYNNKYGLNIKSHGTNVNSEGYAENVIITNNILKENSGGIVLVGDRYLVSNNIIIKSKNIGIVIGSLDSNITDTIKNINISNNIIDEAGTNGVSISDYATDIVLSNNIIRKSKKNAITSSSNWLTVIGGSIIDCVGTAINVNPNNNESNFINIQGVQISNRETTNTTIGVNLSVNVLKSVIQGCSVINVPTPFKNNSVGECSLFGNSWIKNYGSTSERPTVSKGAYSGQVYFDTTLNKPIWRNKDNNGWVDSIGLGV